MNQDIAWHWFWRRLKAVQRMHSHGWGYKTTEHYIDAGYCLDREF